MLPLICFGMSQYATAATVYWDGADTTSGNGSPAGGTGTWNTATNWTNDAAGTTNQAWVDGDDAVFGGTGGTVTLGSAQSVGDITFSTDGYTLTNTNILRAVLFANAVNSYTVTNAGDTATIETIVGMTGGISPNALTKLGDGKLILSGSKNYSGVTTISAGTLEAIGFSVKNIINNGIYISNIEAGSTSNYSSIISGSGSVVKTGNGNLTLMNANTYTGTTTVNAGKLQTRNLLALGNNGAVTVNGGVLAVLSNNLSIGSLAGTGGSVDLGGSQLLTTGGDNTSTTYSGVISGSGGQLTKEGTGTFNLTGNNTYSGVTTVNAGTLQIGNGGTSGSLGSGNVTNNSALIFNRSDDSSYAGIISGSGTTTKEGSGNFNLTGTNTYSGATTVNNGTLSVNGSIANSNTTVNSGGTLGGTGTVGDVTVNSGGTFAPGNSIGTINVTGDVSFAAGSNYNVEVNAAGNADKIIASGTATLTGATVNVKPEAGSYNYATDYTILTATGGFGGTEFASINSNFAFLIPTLSYDATNVFLNLTRNDVSFSSVANTPNQTAVSTVIENNTTALQTIVSNITPLSDTAAQQAFDSLSGIQHTHNQAVISKLGLQFQQLLLNHRNQSILGSNTQKMSSMQSFQVADNSDSWQHYLTESLSSQRHWWMQGLGSFGSIDDSANASGADYQSGGFAFGMDTIWRDYVVGFAGSYSHTNVDSLAGDSDIDSFQTGAFARWEEDDIYINTSVGLGIHNVDAVRTVTVGSSVNTVSSDYDSVNLTTALESGKYIKLDETTTFTPYAGVSYSHSMRDDFSERGAGIANLNVDKQDEDSLRTTLGLRLSRDLQTSNHTVITPALNLAYVHEFFDDTAELAAGFADAPAANFKVDGSELDRNRLVVGVGLTGQLNERTTLNIGYNGEIAGSDDNHSVAATIKLIL